MPTVLRVGSYRFHFYAGDRDEPPHIHVREGIRNAKFWLVQVRLARNRGMSEHQLAVAERIVREHQNELLEAWNAFMRQG